MNKTDFQTYCYGCFKYSTQIENELYTSNKSVDELQEISGKLLAEIAFLKKMHIPQAQKEKTQLLISKMEFVQREVSQLSSKNKSLLNKVQDIWNRFVNCMQSSGRFLSQKFKKLSSSLSQLKSRYSELN